MPAPRKLTAFFCENVKPAPAGGRLFYWDKQVPGLALRVTDRRHRSWVVQRRLNGRMRRWTLGGYIAGAGEDRDAGAIGSIAWARHKAHAMLTDIGRGIDPAVAEDERRRADARKRDNTLASVAERFIEKHVRTKLRDRTQLEYERPLRKLIIPLWGPRPIGEISRREIKSLLERIAISEIPAVKLGKDQGEPLEGGPVASNRTLAVVRKMFNWIIEDEGDLLTASPVVGIKPQGGREKARERVLTDDEIRVLWSACDRAGGGYDEAFKARFPDMDKGYPFGTMVKFLLLTGQRRDEVAAVRWSEIQDDLWTISAERYKGKRPHVVPLSISTRRLLKSAPPLGDYVFSTRGAVAFSGFRKGKAELDAAMMSILRQQALEAGADPAKVTLTSWTLHDLRRTAKTLMTRSGVPHFIADRVLGHAIQGVGHVYDRHDYLKEKRQALNKLTTVIEGIFEPVNGNVVDLTTARVLR